MADRHSKGARWRTWVWLLWLGALLLAGCDEAPHSAGPRYGEAPAQQQTRIYRLAVHPLHNPARLLQAYQPLADYLADGIPGARFEVEASRDYADFERKLRTGGPDLLLPNPWQALQAMASGYTVLAMAGDAEDFKGILVVRRSSPIRTPADLKGRTLAYPSPTALAACIMPQWYLSQAGLDVNRDLVNRYVGSQESAIMNAYLGQADAGVTWPPPWRAFVRQYPEKAAELQVIWETPPLMNNAFMARRDLPVELRGRIRHRLLALQDSEAGRRILAGMETARFHPASDADYDRVRAFIARFEARVRKVEKP
ncbi:MAG: phosphate/phosphite/phosphonate ABC transporter substrate-binding protein [Pseudomonadota bacterium]